MLSCTAIHGSQRTNPTNLGDSLLEFDKGLGNISILKHCHDVKLYLVLDSVCGFPGFKDCTIVKQCHFLDSVDTSVDTSPLISIN